MVNVVGAAIASLNCLDYTPNNPPVPCFYAAEYDIDLHKAFKRGMDQTVLTFRLLVSAADEQSSLQLSAYLNTSGSSSVVAALEGARGSIGDCDDFIVQRIEAHRRYTIGACEYYGADFTVFVIGTGA
jgi:hypothetical protein